MRKWLYALILCSVGAQAQLVLPICSPQSPCPGFPLGSVQAGVDANGWRNFKLILTQNVTQFSFVGTPPPSQASVTVIFTQDGTGGRTVTFASNIRNACGVSATANVTTLCQFEFDGTTGLWIGISAAGTGSGPITDQGGQVFNVKAYGAVCDGVTNDFAAFMGAGGAVTAANAANGGIVLIPQNSTCIVNGQIVLNSGTILRGSDQTTSIIKASSSLSANTTFIISNNFGGVNCSGSSFTACPNGFGIFYLTIDANCGSPNGGGNNTPCAGGGGRGTGTGDAVDFSGYRWMMAHVNIFSAPNVGFHHEIAGGGLSIPYFSSPFTYDRNAATMEDVGIFLSNGNGIEDYGPPDSIYTKVLSESNNGINLLVGCTAGGACGGQVYYSDFHGAHSNTADCADIQALVLFNNFQCESTQTSGKFNVNVDEGPNVGTITQNFGAMSGSVMDIGGGNFAGSGLRINSPQSTNDFTHFPLGNSISGLKSWVSGGTGVTCTSLATRTYVQGTVGQNGTDIAWTCPGQAAQISYAGTGTDVSFNQFLGGPIPINPPGCNVAPGAGVTLSGSLQTIMSCTIPAACMQPGAAFEWKATWSHTNGAATYNYAYVLNGTVLVATITGVNATVSGFTQRGEVYVTSGSTNLFLDLAVQQALGTLITGSGAVGAATAVTTGSAVTFAFQASGTAPDTVVPKELFLKCYTTPH